MFEGSAPRAEKVAVVKEVAEKLEGSVAVFVSEYRGLTVSDLAELRAPLREAGAEHKVYKNTLVKLAAKEAGFESLDEHLVGPTALTFVTGDAAAAAKALKDRSKVNPTLVLKGGVLGGSAMSADDLKALADHRPRMGNVGRPRAPDDGQRRQHHHRQNEPGNDRQHR